MPNAPAPSLALPKPAFPPLLDQAELDLLEMRRQMRIAAPRFGTGGWVAWMKPAPSTPERRA